MKSKKSSPATQQAYRRCGSSSPGPGPTPAHTTTLRRVRPPSVDKLARSLADTGLPHPLLVEAARAAIEAGDPARARAEAEQIRVGLLRPVVNATGVLLHTNLGRAPWPHQDAGGYSNLEFDLSSGKRGSRRVHAGDLLARACGAEAALVLNNCASAVMLALAALGHGCGVAVSRGELVEIGGAFRVPDVMAQSGANLIEVGTTNRTRRADYERAVADPNADLALVLKVHQSNYRIIGFTEDVPAPDLVGIGVPVLADIGSGLLDSRCPWLPGEPPTWLDGEPAARQTLESGVDLVMFSGDKLLGGPQAGIIAGSAELVDRCAAHPLARALRPGGLVLGALQDLAMAYLGRDLDRLPFWQMVNRSVPELRARAEALGVGRPIDTMAVPGGGTLPGIDFPSYGVAMDGDHTQALRRAELPIIARVEDDMTICDLRTVDPAHDHLLTTALGALG
ncbi:MAG: L-seryl-tRNA(Sec) selenium transferase [Actinomycetia bacterium]|nr:L-seryl-tRNA(Sec) selenium transferase [Actinomycetes bacterium]MCP3910175.1 L-seryl-tRNA(Sec) selenium transferase [Actinomycetes bacterium]MCP4084999.1 L-seryl-tRNA(Sec) selenium transferase [Actinomycetes bacterium]